MDHLASQLEAALDDASLSRRDAPVALLVRPTIRQLLGIAAQDWGLLLASWVGMALTPLWLWPLWAVIAGSRLHAFGVILHDAAHLPLRSKTWDVRLLEALCGFPLATTLNAMRYHHLRHHKDNGMPTDPYFKQGVDESWLLWTLNVVRGVLLIPFWTLRPWFALAVRVRPSLKNVYGRVWLQDRSGEDLTASTEVDACVRADLSQLLVQLPVIVAFVLWPRPMVLGYGIPVTLAGVLAAWRLLVEHRYVPVTDRRIRTIFATTWDHHLQWWQAWLLAPRNIGYHVVHHIHPQVGLLHLPALREWYRQQHPDHYPDPR